MNPLPTSSSNHVHLHFRSSDLLDLLIFIIRTRATGSLTLNFSQGSVSGSLEWKERSQVPPPTLPPDTPATSLLDTSSFSLVDST